MAEFRETVKGKNKNNCTSKFYQEYNILLFAALTILEPVGVTFLYTPTALALMLDMDRHPEGSQEGSGHMRLVQLLQSIHPLQSIHLIQSIHHLQSIHHIQSIHQLQRMDMELSVTEIEVMLIEPKNLQIMVELI